uniref:Microtubule actin crosslinking factor 1 n=1 Tax=Gadus morhua TaxID=8049 RepID=A0A8C5CUT3_GADMO
MANKSNCDILGDYLIKLYFHPFSLPPSCVPDERDRVQKKTFTKWVNKHLIKVRKHITDLYEDLRDGHNLISLLEVLSGVTLPREKGRMRFHRLQNVQIALDFLKQRQVKLVNIRNDDITDGNPKLTLGLIWTIILHFQISEIYVSGESGDLTAKEKLLLWTQQATEGYPGLRCSNFTSSWSNGRLFNALLHRYRPDLIDMEVVTHQSNRDNLEQAFEIAESLGVTRLLDAEDVDVPSPDEKSVITYVASIYDAFPKIPEGGEGIPAHEVDQRWSEYQTRFSSLMQWSRKHTALMADKNFPQNPVELKALYNQYIHFKETEIPIKEMEKSRVEHLYKLLEVWIEFGRIKLPQGIHPNELEVEWGKLILEMLDREKALRPAVDRVELLLQMANKIQNTALDCEEKLTLAKNTLQADMSRMESGEGVQCEGELACYLQDCEGLIRQLNQDVRGLREERYYQVDQLELVSLRLQCSSVYRKGHFSSQSLLEQTAPRPADRGLSLGQTLLGAVGAVGAVGAALLRRPMARSQLVAMSSSEDEGSLRFIYELLGWVEETQDLLEGAEWGADLPSVENNLQEHNEIHTAVQELLSSIQEGKVSPNFKNSYCETMAKLEHQYCKLLERSSWRLRSLESLHGFVTRCTEELIWLNEREEEEMAYDWGHGNTSLDTKKELYTEMRSELDEKQDMMQVLQETADRLCQENHPAKQTVEAYSAALQTQWQWVRQLCVCVEQHLKDNAAYFQFMNEVRDCESYLRQLQDTIKRQYTCDRNSRLGKLEDLLQDSMEEKEQLIEYRRSVASLVGRAKAVVQLRPRSTDTPLGAATPIRAICDYRQIEITISRGEECVLEDNSQRTKWKVISPSGNEAMVPSVCFTVPPPNQEAIDTASRMEQMYQKVMSLWHQLHMNMKSVVSWHYLTKDLRTMRSQSPPERDQALDELESHLADFLSDSKESALFTPAERSDLEKEAQQAQKHCQDLLLNMETGREIYMDTHKWFSVPIASWITTVCGPPTSLPRFPPTQKMQAELEALQSSVGEVSRRCVGFFQDKPTSSSVPAMRSELSQAVEKMDKLYNLSHVFLQKSVHCCQGSTHCYGAQDGVLRSLQAEVERAREAGSQLARLHPDRSSELERYQERANQMAERWSNVERQMETRRADLEVLGSSLQQYKDGHSGLISWIEETTERQENTQPGQMDSKALSEQLAQQTALVVEIEANQTKLDQCQINAKQYCTSVKDYELQLMTYRAFVESTHKSSLKRRRMHSSSDAISQEFMDLRTRYTALVTLTTQHVKYISDALRRIEEEEFYIFCFQAVTEQLSARKEEVAEAIRSTQVFLQSKQFFPFSQKQTVIAGIIDMGSMEIFSVFSAAQCGLIDQETCRFLLEAQLISGGLLQPPSPQSLSLEHALAQGMIDNHTSQSLSYLERALHLVNETKSKEGEKQCLLPVAIALEEGVISEHLGLHILEVHMNTGGLRYPSGELVDLDTALEQGLLPSRIYIKLQSQLQRRELIDPNTAERLSLSELQQRCISHEESGLHLLPVKQQSERTVSLRSGRKVGIFRASQEGLVDQNVTVRLLEAQLFAGGIVDPRSGNRLILDEALSQGLMHQNQACTILARQLQTGGILDPRSGERLGLDESLCRDLLSPSLALLVLESLQSFMGMLWPESGELVPIAEALQQGGVSEDLARNVLGQRHVVGALYDVGALHLVPLSQTSEKALDLSVAKVLSKIHIPDVLPSTPSSPPSTNRISWCSTSSSPSPSSQPPGSLTTGHVWDSTPLDSSETQEQAKHVLLSHLMTHSYVDVHSGKRLVLLDAELVELVKATGLSCADTSPGYQVQEEGSSLIAGSMQTIGSIRTLVYSAEGEKEETAEVVKTSCQAIPKVVLSSKIIERKGRTSQESKNGVGDRALQQTSNQKIEPAIGGKGEKKIENVTAKGEIEIAPRSENFAGKPLSQQVNKSDQHKEVRNKEGSSPSKQADTSPSINQDNATSSVVNTERVYAELEQDLAIVESSKTIDSAGSQAVRSMGYAQIVQKSDLDYKSQFINRSSETNKTEEEAEMERLTIELKQGGLLTEEGDRLLPDEAVAQGILPGQTAVKLMSQAGLFGGFLDATSGELLSLEDVMQEDLLDEDLMWSVLKSDKSLSGVVDIDKGNVCGLREAAQKGLIDSNTASRLLEAQVLSGGIVDLNRDEKVSVTLAANLGLIKEDQKESLEALENAYKGKATEPQTAIAKATIQLQMEGIVDPESRSPVPLECAIQKGLIGSEEAYQALSKQVAEGGILHHASGTRLSVSDALERGLVDRSLAPGLEELQCVYKGNISLLAHPEAALFQASTGAIYSPESERKLTLTEAVSKGLLEEKVAKEAMASDSVTQGVIDPQSCRIVPYSHLVHQGKIDLNTGKRFLEVKQFSGIQDEQTGDILTLKQAIAIGKVDPVPALRLLQSQADSGGIIDITSGDRLPLPEASEKGLIEEDMAREIAINQITKGGLIHPTTGQRVANLDDAIIAGLISSEMAFDIQESMTLAEIDEGEGSSTPMVSSNSAYSPGADSSVASNQVKWSSESSLSTTPLLEQSGIGLVFKEVDQKQLDSLTSNQLSLCDATLEEDTVEQPLSESDSSIDLLAKFASNVGKRIQQAINEIKPQKAELKQGPGEASSIRERHAFGTRKESDYTGITAVSSYQESDLETFNTSSKVQVAEQVTITRSVDLSVRADKKKTRPADVRVLSEHHEDENDERIKDAKADDVREEGKLKESLGVDVLSLKQLEHEYTEQCDEAGKREIGGELEDTAETILTGEGTDVKHSDQSLTASDKEAEAKSKKKKKSKKKGRGKESENKPLPLEKSDNVSDIKQMDSENEGQSQVTKSITGVSPLPVKVKILESTPERDLHVKDGELKIDGKVDAAEVSLVSQDDQQANDNGGQPDMTRAEIVRKQMEECVDKQYGKTEMGVSVQKGAKRPEKSNLPDNEKAALIMKAKESILKKVFEKGVTEKQAAEELEALRKEVHRKDIQAGNARDGKMQTPVIKMETPSRKMATPLTKMVDVEGSTDEDDHRKMPDAKPKVEWKGETGGRKENLKVDGKEVVVVDEPNLTDDSSLALKEAKTLSKEKDDCVGGVKEGKDKETVSPDQHNETPLRKMVTPLTEMVDVGGSTDEDDLRKPPDAKTKVEWMGKTSGRKEENLKVNVKEVVVVDEPNLTDDSSLALKEAKTLSKEKDDCVGGVKEGKDKETVSPDQHKETLSRKMVTPLTEMVDVEGSTDEDDLRKRPDAKTKVEWMGKTSGRKEENLKVDVKEVVVVDEPNLTDDSSLALKEAKTLSKEKDDCVGGVKEGKDKETVSPDQHNETPLRKMVTPLTEMVDVEGSTDEDDLRKPPDAKTKVEWMGKTGGRKEENLKVNVKEVVVVDEPNLTDDSSLALKEAKTLSKEKDDCVGGVKEGKDKETVSPDQHKETLSRKMVTPLTEMVDVEGSTDEDDFRKRPDAKTKVEWMGKTGGRKEENLKVDVKEVVVVDEPNLTDDSSLALKEAKTLSKEKDDCVGGVKEGKDKETVSPDQHKETLSRKMVTPLTEMVDVEGSTDEDDLRKRPDAKTKVEWMGKTSATTTTTSSLFSVPSHLHQEFQAALTARSNEVIDAAFDVQVFISERAQDLAPEQSRHLLGQLQRLQGAFHQASGQARARAETLSNQRAREEELQQKESAKVQEEEKEREIERQTARKIEVWMHADEFIDMNEVQKDLQSKAEGVAGTIRSVEDFLSERGDCLSPEERESLQGALRKMKEHYADLTNAADASVTQLDTAISTTLTQNTQRVRGAEGTMGNGLAEEVICHKADLRFVSISGQKVLDSVQGALEQAGGSDPALDSTKQLVTDKLHDANHRYTALHTKSSELGGRLSGLLERSQQYQDEAVSLHSWLSSQEQERDTARPSGDTNPQNLQKPAVNFLCSLCPSDGLERRFDTLSASVSERAEQLQTAVAQSVSVQEGLKGLLSWLDQLVLSPGPVQPTAQKLRQELLSRQGSVDATRDSLSKLLQSADAATASDLQGALAQLNGRYAAAQASQTEREAELKVLLPRLESYERLGADLQGFTQSRLKALGPVGQPEHSVDDYRQTLEVILSNFLISSWTEVLLLAVESKMISSQNALFPFLRSDSRWQKANETAAQRQTELETCADRLGSFATAASQLGPWLREKELMMSVLGPLSIDPNMLNTQKQQVQFMLREFDTRRPQYDELTQSAEGILSQSGDAPQDPKDLQEVRAELGSISKQWEDLTSRLDLRSGRIDRAQGTSERYQALLKELAASVGDLGERLDGQASLSAQPEALRSRLQETGEVRSELELRRAELGEAERLCEELSAIVDEPYLREELSKRLEAVGAPLRTDGLSQLQAALSSTQQFQQMFDELRCWLDNQADTRDSSADSLPCQPEALRSLLAHAEDLQRGIAAQRGSYELLQAEGASLLAALPAGGDERSALQSRLSGLRQDWDGQNQRATDRQNRLKSTLAKAETYQKHRAELVPWLEECEGKDVEIRPSLDPAALDEALQRARTLSMDLDRRRPLVDALNTAADQLLEQCRVGEEEVRDEKAQLNRRVDGLGERVHDHTSQLEELAGRLKEFQEGRQSVERRLDAAKHQIEVQEALGPQVILSSINSVVSPPPQVEQCSAALESRLQGVGEVQTHVRDVFSRLADLDDELDSLSPVGRDGDSLASQAEALRGLLARVGDLRHQLDGHGTECTAMLRREGSSPDLLALRRETEALSRQAGKLNERGQVRLGQIEDAAEKVREFYGLVAELQGMLGRAEEGLNAQGLVGTEVEIIKQQLQEFKVGAEEENEPPRLKHVNAVGQGLIQSAAKHTDTQALEHDLENTNLQWNSLNKRVAERIAQLQEALLHCGKFQDALEPLLSWLSDTEELVANQKPPSAEYRVVKAQIQEQKLLQRLLDDRRPTVQMIQAEGERIAATADAQDRDKIQSQLQSLGERWTELLDKASGRQRKLEELQGLALQFHEALEPLGEWLSATERRLTSAEPMGTQTAKISQQISKHKSLNEEIVSRKKTVDQAIKNGQALLKQTTGEEVLLIQEKLDGIKTRYAEMTAGSSKALRTLEQALQLSTRFASAHDDLNQWLDTVEAELNNMEPDATPAYQERQKELKKLSAEKRLVLDTVNEVGSALLDLVPWRAREGLDRLVADANQRYRQADETITQRVQLVQAAIQRSQQLEEAVDAELAWARETERKLSSLGPLSLEPDVTVAQLQVQRAFNIDIIRHKDTVDQLLATHSDILDTCTDAQRDTKTDALSERYEAVSQKHSERFSALEQAQVLVARFWETYEELEPWLGETETLIAQLPPAAIDTDALRLQQDQMRLLRESIAEHKPHIDKLLKIGPQMALLSAQEGPSVTQRYVDSERRYLAIKEEVKGRAGALDEAVSQSVQFHDKMDPLLETLEGAVQRLRQPPPVAAEVDKIREQLGDHRAQGLELDKLLPSFSALCSRGEELIGRAAHDDPAAQAVRSRLLRLRSLWEEIRQRAEEREAKLSDVLDLAEKFWADMAALLSTLRDSQDIVRELEDPGVDPSLIKQQIEAAEAIKGETDGLREELEFVRTLGADLIFACGETEKPEVKKTIDEMNGAWEGLNRTWRERMERLEEAMTASVQYQDALQGMFDYLDNAVIKLCDMPTVGTDLGTVKQQIEELKQYKVEVYQQQIDMEKLCHQGELLLKKVSDQTDRDMIQEPLTELRHLWENLGDKITHRQHKLEGALLALGQFQHALSELQAWLNHTHATLDTQRPVNSDPKAIEIELAKHHVLRNDVLSHHSTVEAVNGAGAELLESTPGDEVSHLRDQLDTLNSGWESLLLKTQERQKLLEAALHQAEGFHGDLEEFLQWLRRTETQLSAAKPTGGLPETAREQLQQHMVTQRAEHYHGLLDQGEAMLLARGGEEGGPGTTQTQQNLAMLQNKWASLSTKIDDRRGKLEEALSLATGFQSSLQDTINWLTQAEQTLNMAQAPSLILDTVLFQIDEHKVFVNEVNTHREQVLALEKAGSQLRFASLKQDVVLIKNLLLSVQARWDKLVQRSLDRGRHLDEARKRAKQFHEAWRKLTDWLEEAESRLDSELEISNEPDKIKLQLSKHKEFQKALGSKQPVYDTTVRSGKAMRDKTQLPSDTQKLDHLLGELRDKWDTVCGKSVERQHKLEEALLFSGQFAEALQALVDWLYRVEPQLAEDQPVHGDLDLVSNLMDTHKAFQKELGKRTSSIQALKRSARELMDTGRDDTAWVKVQLQELSNRWDTVCALSVSKQTRLQQAVKQAEEFRTNVQILLEWLSEAEQTLRFRGVLPEEADTLQTLLHTHRDFMGTVEEKRSTVNSAAGMGEAILTQCHPDSVTTIKHWITIIRARFEEVLTWAKQHEQRLETALNELLNNANLLEELLSWLQYAETALIQRDTEPLPQDITQLKSLITEHQVFMEEMTRKQPDVDKVTKTYKRKPAEVSSSLAERRGHAAMLIASSNPRLNQLCARWQQVWLLALDRQRKLNDALDRLEELKEFANFDFDVWRKKYMRWMNHKKSRVMDFFRRIDKDQDGKITRQEFIDGILASKFPTSRLEMTAVADIFDRDGDGYIDYYEFVAALHPNKDAYRPTTDADKIEDEVTRQVAQCKCAKRFQVEQIGENKYRFFLGNQFGDSQQLRLVRILRSTVMVRVGGGWMALDEFLVKNDPCRVQHPGLKILRCDSSSSISSRIARGRTNLELREKFIIHEGVSQGLAAFRSRGRRSKPGSRTASPTRSSSSASHSAHSCASLPSTPATPTASSSSSRVSSRAQSGPAATRDPDV